MRETEESTYVANIEDESDEELKIDEGEDISYTYGWPPLVCCFGAAQHAFVPSGRPANRLIDYEIHERMKDALWSPEKFVRSPGGSAGSVAIALASLGGKVAFMGKLGTDDYGEAMLYYLNVNSVQTRSVRIDSKRETAVSYMKIGKRGRLKMTCVKPCAEDSLSKSEINIDVLKEVKDFILMSLIFACWLMLLSFIHESWAGIELGSRKHLKMDCFSDSCFYLIVILLNSFDFHTTLRILFLITYCAGKNVLLQHAFSS